MVALAATLFSCSDDPDTVPDNNVQSQASQPLLEGDWQAVTSDGQVGHTLHFRGNVATQKSPDGSIERVSIFRLVNESGKNTIFYKFNISEEEGVASAPNLFNYGEIVSASFSELVLESSGETQSFKSMDPAK